MTIHRPPDNSARKSDPQYWYLREVQSLVSVPIGTAQSTLQKLRLIDTTCGDALTPLRLASIRDPDGFVLLTEDGRTLHLFLTGALQHVLRVELGGMRARDLSTDAESVYLALDDSRFAAIPIHKLGEARSRSPIAGTVAVESLMVRLTQAVDAPTELSKLRMLPFSPNSGAEQLLLYGARLDEIFTLTWFTARSPVQAVNIDVTDAVMRSVRIGGAVASSSTDRICLTDSAGGRILQLRIGRLGDGVAVVGGEALPQSNPAFRLGAAEAARLGELSGICEYSISRDTAEILSRVVLPQNPPEWVARGFVQPKSGKDRQKRSEADFRLSHERLASVLHEESGFLVVVDRRHGAALSVTPPPLKPLGRNVPARQRNIWPILPPEVDSSGTPAAHPLPNEVCTGPDSSLILWTSGSEQICVYMPNFESLRASGVMQGTTRRLQELSREMAWMDS